jgi:tetratricopeptide (TPR) repeat protein
MNAAAQNPFVVRLVDHPYDHEALFSVYQATAKDPRAYASLLVEAASQTQEDVAASHWLTEAARVELTVLKNERGTLELLEAALERDPLNLRAAEQMVELYRSHNDDAELTQILKTRAEALRARCAREPVELPRAALAFEKLSSDYEALGDANGAITALRTALELERANTRNTAPSPPPDRPAPSAPRIRTARLNSEQPGVPPPEQSIGQSPVSEPRDTVRSSLPRAVTKDSTVPPTALEEAPPDPLLAVVEALHALRHSEDVVEGAALVLRTALAAIPCAAGFVHVCDVGTRDYVVVAASGPEQAEIVGTRTPEGDAWLGRAMRETQSLTVDANDAEWLTGARFGVVRPLHAVLCAPVQFDGRPLGAIELVDPKRTRTFTLADRHAMTYVGERFAEFLADRSITF